MVTVGRNAPCPCGSGKKYKRCCLAAPQTRAPRHSDLVPQRGETTLIVETATGLVVRRVPNASPLAADLEQGKAAETAIQDSAATWGMPDFVFRPVLDSRPGRVREVGDGLIVVGRLGVVIQSKSRIAPDEIDPVREESWLRKNAERAARQASGTIRTLLLQPTDLENGRGEHVTVDSPSIDWMSVVVLDHPDVPDDLEVDAGDTTVVLIRRDWDFLFDQLRSTYAVVRYLRRVAGEPSRLGGEPARYFDHARADERAAPEVLPAALLGDGVTVSTPLLPLAPAGVEDRRAHLLVRSIFEDAAVAPVRAGTADHRLAVLAELDRFPVGMRAQMGNFLLEALESVRNDPDLFKLRHMRRSVGGAHIAFGATGRYSADRHDGFSAWVQLKHHNLQTITGEMDLLTVGVLLTPRPQGTTPFDTTVSAVQGDLGLTDQDLAAIRAVWDPHAGA